MEESVKHRVFYYFSPKRIQRNQEMFLQHLNPKPITFRLLLLTTIQFVTGKDYSRTVAISISDAKECIKIRWHWKALEKLKL